MFLVWNYRNADPDRMERGKQKIDLGWSSGDNNVKAPSKKFLFATIGVTLGVIALLAIIVIILR